MTTTAPEHLVAGYRASGPGYDEMKDAAGDVRPHWAHVGTVLDGLGLPELRRRAAETARLLEEDGVTYTVYGAPPGTIPRWRLDPVPVIVTSADWARTESAVAQRAELLNLVLTDLYGPRDLLRRGLLPPELVFGHGGFLRPCDGIRIPGANQLFTLAVDLGRDSGGQQWVLADRAQAPSGVGYALENRAVASRVFPSMYRDAHVHRLAPFFRALRGGLETIAPPDVDEPHIVVLSPGPWSETAFEHAFLAARLGYSLVEGPDLVVTGGRVWVRSLGPPQPVDVILRRVDSWFCDPLELRGDSQLGVPGLVEACRRGTVSVVNTIGSSVLENPGLLPFLPKLSMVLLGTDLDLPSVPTWWCGDRAGLSHVLAHLDRLVIKPVTRMPGASAVFGPRASGAELEELRARIVARPRAWVGQEQLTLASAPTLAEAGLVPRRSVLRTFAVARDESYLVMPGGLTRVAPDEGTVISNQTGALSKDTWVLASEPEKTAGSWIAAVPGVTAAGAGAVIPARAAENLFWLGRYAERAEGVVRLLRVTHERRNDFQGNTDPAGTRCVAALLEALTHVTTTYPGFAGAGAESLLADPGPELSSLAVDDSRPGTLAYAVRRLLDATTSVRDQLSLDTWLVVSGLHRELLDVPVLGRATLGRVLGSLLALSGLAAESMVRDAGWHFMDAGRRIERAIQLSALLRATVTRRRDPDTEGLVFESVLTAAESIVTYRRRYRSHTRLETLLDLLLHDPDNPRSLVHQLNLLAEDLQQLPARPGAARVSAAEKKALETATAVRLAESTRLAAADEHGVRAELDALLARTTDGLHATGDALGADHFFHPARQQQMVL